MIDFFKDVFKGELEAGGDSGMGSILTSPFSSQQPPERHMHYHMPARFSPEVIRGIRHAAAKAFQVCLLPTATGAVALVLFTNQIPLMVCFGPLTASAFVTKVEYTVITKS